MKNITAKQERVYDFICAYIDTHGYPPSVREIGDGLGLRSPATVKHHLDKLVASGFLSISAGRTRAITVLDLGLKENMVPMLGSVAAGNPILAEELVEEYLPFDTGGRREEFFALRVRGNSMLNAGILPDDCVVVHKQEEVNHGEIVVAIFEDEATVKTLHRKNGETLLMPENEDYEPIDGTYARIIGKVVGVVRRY